MSIKQISVFLENKPGALEAMTDVLAKSNISLRALSMAEADGFGIVRLIADDVYETTTVLKDADFINTLTPVLAVKIPDEAGGLHKILKFLQSAEINIEYMYASLGGKNSNEAYMIFRVGDDTAKAEAILKTAGFAVVDQDSITNM